MLSNAGAGQSISVLEEDERKGIKHKSAIIYTGKGIDTRAALALKEEIRKTISPEAIFEITDPSYFSSLLTSHSPGESCFVIPGGNTMEVVMAFGNRKSSIFRGRSPIMDKDMSLQPPFIRKLGSVS